MARARTLKPGFFSNDLLAEVHPLGRILFAGMWCFSDRDGRLEDRPKRLKAEILGYDDCDVDGLLNQLAERGFILRYEVGGVRYIQVLAFRKHQNPHQKEAASSIPPHAAHDVRLVQEQCSSCSGDNLAPDEHEASTGQATTQTGTSRAVSLLPITVSLLPIPDNRSCAETESVSTPEAPGADLEPTPQLALKPPVLTLPALCDETFEVHRGYIERLQEQFPACHVEHQFRRMQAWLEANPKQKKTLRGMPRFAVNWLSRQQDRGGDAEQLHSGDAIPYQQIVDAYNGTMTQLPKVLVLDVERKDAMQKFWDCDPKYQNLAFVRQYFEECAHDAYLNGTGPYGNGLENWSPTFDYLLRPRVVTRVFEKAMSRRSGQ